MRVSTFKFRPQAVYFFSWKGCWVIHIGGVWCHRNLDLLGSVYWFGVFLNGGILAPCSNPFFSEACMLARKLPHEEATFICPMARWSLCLSFKGWHALWCYNVLGFFSLQINCDIWEGGWVLVPGGGGDAGSGCCGPERDPENGHLSPRKLGKLFHCVSHPKTSGDGVVLQTALCQQGAYMGATITEENAVAPSYCCIFPETDIQRVYTMSGDRGTVQQPWHWLLAIDKPHLHRKRPVTWTWTWCFPFSIVAGLVTYPSLVSLINKGFKGNG